MTKEFRDFLMRGNVIDLAVAVLIGAAFGAVVTSFSADIITPIIGIFGGTPNFSAVTFSINGSEFRIGAFINAIIAFVIMAAIIFFVVVKPMNAAMARMKKPDAAAAPATKMCPECLSDIPLGARRCAFCTAVLDGVPA